MAERFPHAEREVWRYGKDRRLQRHVCEDQAAFNQNSRDFPLTSRHFHRLEIHVDVGNNPIDGLLNQKHEFDGAEVIER